MEERSVVVGSELERSSEVLDRFRGTARIELRHAAQDAGFDRPLVSQDGILRDVERFLDAAELEERVSFAMRESSFCGSAAMARS